VAHFANGIGGGFGRRLRRAGDTPEPQGRRTAKDSGSAGPSSAMTGPQIPRNPGQRGSCSGGGAGGHGVQSGSRSWQV